MRFRKTISSFLAVLVLVAPSVLGKIEPPRLEEMVRHADLIVIGKVAQVHKKGKIRIAEVEVAQIIKGDIAFRKIFYLATGTWTCDTSDAKEGETSVLFLSKPPNWPKDPFFREQSLEALTELCDLIQGQPFFVLSYSGRGRMPFATSAPNHQQRRVIVSGEVICPNSFKIIRRQRPSGYAWDYEELVNFGVVHSYIKQKLTEQQNSKASSI